MAAKKKRGLSGSPEHHAGEAKVLRFSATRQFKEAEAKAKSRSCSAALERLMDANATYAQADLHDVEGRSFSMSPAGIEARSFAVGAFKTNCLGTRLSGMKRRSRR